MMGRNKVIGALGSILYGKWDNLVFRMRWSALGKALEPCCTCAKGWCLPKFQKGKGEGIYLIVEIVIGGAEGDEGGEKKVYGKEEVRK